MTTTITVTTLLQLLPGQSKHTWDLQRQLRLPMTAARKQEAKHDTATSWHACPNQLANLSLTRPCQNRNNPLRGGRGRGGLRQGYNLTCQRDLPQPHCVIGQTEKQQTWA